ncbi:MAG: preprotein translocase subunit SecE [Acidobacteriota bacterium]
MEKIKYFFTQFLPEVKAEWKKVTTPNRQEVTQTTIVVVITSVVFAVYLALADKVIQFLYELMFGAMTS